MPLKKEDEFDEDDESDEKEDKKLSFHGSTAIVGIAFLIISELFFYLLSTKTNANFGFSQIIFGLIVSIALTLFLAWVKFIMKSNKYLGAIIGLAGIGAVIYALTRKYAGTYTTIFAVISGIIAILYIAINLWNFQSK